MGAYPFPSCRPRPWRRWWTGRWRWPTPPICARAVIPNCRAASSSAQFARVLTQCLAARAEGEARYLLLDEPTASLDPRHQGELLRGGGLQRATSAWACW